MRARWNRLKRLLTEAVGPYSEDLSGFWFDVTRRLEDVRRFYSEHEWFRSLCHGFIALLFVTTLDVLMGHQVAVRLLFIVPVFVASYRGEWFSSAFVTASTLMGLTALDFQFKNLDSENAALGVSINILTLALTSAIIVTLQRRIRRIGKIANSDALTGAMNRTAIQSFAEDLIEQASKDAMLVTIGVIDCNGFKRINDVRGHAAGDEVLVHLVQSFEKTLGRYGKIGRIGGDEFVIVVHDRSIEFVQRLIEATQELFSEAVFSTAPLCSFSVGLARYGIDGQSYGELVNKADERMYAVKFATDTVRAAVRIG